MFTISLHKVEIIAPIGLYPQELVLGNHFEVDIDVTNTAETHATSNEFVDYTILNEIIQKAFTPEETTLEALAQKIHHTTFATFPFVQKVKVSIRKMNPPMKGAMAYAQVSFEA